MFCFTPFTSAEYIKNLTSGYLQKPIQTEIPKYDILDLKFHVRCSQMYYLL